MIFNELMNDPVFYDRYRADDRDAVDVVIPMKGSHFLFRSCLLSVYREVPVRQLIVGDGGCSWETLMVLEEFPRVRVVDQRMLKTLGFCIRDLINRVSTSRFLYLHSDVYLPDGWFDYFKCSEGDWVESRMYHAVMVCYVDGYEDNAIRAFSGAQLGDTRMLQKAVESIQDDFLYRNEDIVIRELVVAAGGVYRRSDGLRCYHTQMYTPERVAGLHIEKKYDKEQELKMLRQQIQGILKYTRWLKPYLIKIVLANMLRYIKVKIQ